MYCKWSPHTQILSFDFFREWQNKTNTVLLLPFRPLKVALWHTLVAFIYQKHSFCLWFHLGIIKFPNKRNVAVKQFYCILHQFYFYYTDRKFLWGLWIQGPLNMGLFDMEPLKLGPYNLGPFDLGAFVQYGHFFITRNFFALVKPMEVKIVK